MAVPFDGSQERKTKAAMAWLRAELAAGPQPAGEMQRRGREAGHAERTLQTAAQRLHITPQRVYEQGRLKHFVWELPTVHPRPTRRKR